ncbi:hypothetical protein BD289DRAFT_335760, partial [Coniella lustricola]
HPADEVYVTGTFDNWSKSEKMEKIGDVFEKAVELPDTSEKIYYKFVVDGTWILNDTDPKEKDGSGFENNVLTPETVLASLPGAAAYMNSVSDESTTAQLAKDVPLEKETPSGEGYPGAFPVTPADELNKTIGISPLPASKGGDNPITLAPGEPVPEEFKTADITSEVKLDKASYEKGDELPGVDTSALDIPPISGTMIPESSLPIGGAGLPIINSASADSTTAALAAEVPTETAVPEIVKESQEKAGVDPEASAEPEEVLEKQAVEEELKEKVPEAPSTSEGTAGKGTEKSEGDKTLVETVAATAAGIGAAAAATLYATQDKVVEQATQLPDSVREVLPTAVQETIAAHPAAKESKIEDISPEVPAEVKESILEASESPEAAANTQAVEEKKAVEAELLQEVKPVEGISDVSQTSAPVVAALETPKVEDIPAGVPTEVKESIAEASQSPEAAANVQAVEEKKAMEAELLKEVKPAEGISDSTKPAVVALEDPKVEDVPAQVPAEVKESIAEASKSPEAAANVQAVEDKKAVEAELLQEVTPVAPVSDAPKTEEPVTATQEAPQVVEPPAAPKDV